MISLCVLIAFRLRADSVLSCPPYPPNQNARTHVVPNAPEPRTSPLKAAAKNAAPAPWDRTPHDPWD
jgi:hypothetical protein